MYFLIGLGIILAIVYANMLFDYIRDRKKKQQDSAELPEAVASAGTEQRAEAVLSAYAGQMAASEAVGVAVSVTERAAALHNGYLADIIETKLREKQYVFGLPLTVCETDGQGKLITLDREDNICIIETAVRPEYEDMSRQVLEDMAVERRRIGKKAGERKVYAIVCSCRPSESLLRLAEREKTIRVFRPVISFENIM